MALDPDMIREFVIAGHFNLEKVTDMLAKEPQLLMAEHQWGPDDFETCIGAAAHVGNRPIAEFLLDQGATSNICVAAMLGQVDEVAAYLQADPAQANARGAHNITVMFHAAMSGNTALTELLKGHGCTEGYSYAIHAAINCGHVHMVDWLLNNGKIDLTVQDYQGKTLLQNAEESEQPTIAAMLRQRGATT